MDIITILLLIAFSIIIVWGIKKENKENFFDVDYSKSIRGICCIIVIFTHIPILFSNKVQDAVGSFGYIAVSLFFMFSAYGLRISLDKKKNYLSNFLRNRFLVILIPYVIACSFFTIRKLIVGEISGFGPIVLSFLGIEKTFIGLFLCFYLLFFIVYRYIKVSRKIQDLIICSVILIYSAIYGFFDINLLGWHVEILGVVYGILIARYLEHFIRFSNKKIYLKIAIVLILAISLGVLYLKFKTVFILGSYLLKILLGISLISLIMIATTQFRIHNRILKFLGNISYEVFLYHGLILLLLEAIIDSEMKYSSGIFIVSAIFGTIILSFIMYLINTKITSYVKVKNKPKELQN